MLFRSLHAVGLIKPAAFQEPAVPGRNWLEPAAPQEPAVPRCLWLKRILMSVFPPRPLRLRLEPPAPQEFWLLRWALDTWHIWFNMPVVLNGATVLAILLMGIALIPTCMEAWATANKLSWRLKDMETVYAREQRDLCWWLVHTKSPAYKPGSFLIELQDEMSVSEFDIFLTSRFYTQIWEHCRKK